MAHIGGIEPVRMGWLNEFLGATERIKEATRPPPKVNVGEPPLITGVHVSISEAAYMASQGVRPPEITQVTYVHPAKIKSFYLPDGATAAMIGKGG